MSGTHPYKSAKAKEEVSDGREKSKHDDIFALKCSCAARRPRLPRVTAHAALSRFDEVHV